MNRSKTNKAVFLDRDGVLNAVILRNNKPHPPRNVADVVILEGVLEALNALKQNGFLLIVVTNQPDVARGITSKKRIEAIHQFLYEKLPLDAIFVCYHDDMDNCNCRKPKDGLLLQAKEAYQINLKQSYMVGDRWRDIEAGLSAGCTSIFIDYGYSEKKAEAPDYVTQSLLEAADWIIKR